MSTARAHTKNTYGTRTVPDADPTLDGPLHQVVESTTGASRSPDPTVVNETDVRTTRYAYGLATTGGLTTGEAKAGWTHKTPLRVTTLVPGGTDIVHETVLDAATGLVKQTRQPSAAGQTANAGTRVTTYYTGSGSGGCVQAAWANLPCTITVGAQPGTSGLPQLPTTTYTAYDYLLRPTTITETVVDAGGTTRTRTTTSTFENSGWSPRLLRTYTSGDVGTAVPAIKPTYDPATGLPTGSTTDTTPAPAPGMAGTITIGYDDFGRQTTTTDADAATTTQTYDSAGRPSVTTWLKVGGATLGTRTVTYNSTTERRGLATQAVDSGFGAITGTYNADGDLETQTFANGLVETYTTNTVGDRVDHSMIRSGVTWLRDTQTSNIHSQWTTWNQDGLAARSYTYNGAGRLTVAAAQRAGGDPCEQRTYSFDVNGNRTALARQATPGGGGACTTTSTTTTLSYDTADRLTPTGTGAGIVYDAWGRITTLPSAVAGSTGNGGSISGATGNLTSGYYITDMVASQAHASYTDTWSLDPAQRLRRAVLAGTAKINHYDDGSDSPAWIDEGFADGSLTRFIPGLDGGTVGYIQTANTYTITRHYLADLHGDVKTTTDPAPPGGTPNGATHDTDEYGIPYGGTRRHGWLGDHQRSTDALAGTVLMGVRIYAPTLGRFLSTDPVHGGNDTTYSYPNDPINKNDLNGNAWNWKQIAGRAAKGLSVVSTIASYCPLAQCQAVALATGAASAGLYYAAGQKQAAKRQLATTVVSALTFGRGNFVKKASKVAPRVNSRLGGGLGIAYRYAARKNPDKAARERLVQRNLRFAWGVTTTAQHTYSAVRPPRRR